jgi:hypothetical protein
MSDWTTGAFTLGGVVLGALGTQLTQSLSSRREEVLSTLVHLGDAFSWIWPRDNAYQELMGHIGQLRARARLLSIDDIFVERISETSVACLRNAQGNMNLVEEGDTFIRSDLLDAYIVAVGGLDAALRERPKLFGKLRIARVVRSVKQTP